jgi:hypothetical protein
MLVMVGIKRHCLGRMGPDHHSLRAPTILLFEQADRAAPKSG